MLFLKVVGCALSRLQNKKFFIETSMLNSLGIDGIFQEEVENETENSRKNVSNLFASGSVVCYFSDQM